MADSNSQEKEEKKEPTWKLSKDGNKDPYLINNPTKQTDFSFPKSRWAWKKHKASGGVYFSTGFAPETNLTCPYPDEKVNWTWKYSSEDTVFNGFMIGKAKPALWLQKQRPLIHVYGHTQQQFDKGEEGIFDFIGNGYAIIDPISCVVHVEENGEYTATIETYCDEYGNYKYLKKQALVKIPIKYHGEISNQVFRIQVVTRRMGVDGKLRITAEAMHLFYDNNRYIVKECEVYNTVGENNNKKIQKVKGEDALKYLIKEHGSFLGHNERANYPFGFKTNIANTQEAYYDNSSLTACIMGLDDCFINRWGGKLYRDNYYFSINDKMENSRDIGVIQYGYNMQEIEFIEDDTDVLTDLYAYDNFDNEYTVSLPDVPNETFPHRIYKAVAFSYESDSVDTFEADAKAYFDEYKQSKVTITVRFANLSDYDLYKDFINLDNYEVGDRVTVYHKDMGISFYNLEIVSKTFDVVQQQTTEIVIGNFKNALSRNPLLGGTASTMTPSIQFKQNVAIRDQLKRNNEKMMKTWGSANVFKWSEVTKMKWSEAKFNG